MDAYLDIETTGLSPFFHEITVIGVCLASSSDSRLVQLVGEEVTRDRLLDALEGAGTIFTYNGSGFDLPFIRAQLGVDLDKIFHHHDLMHDCWRNNLYGGFKAVEQQLGIPRQLKGMSGRDAVFLWWKYQNEGDRDSLAQLLQYNGEDAGNLKILREKLIRGLSSRK